MVQADIGSELKRSINEDFKGFELLYQPLVDSITQQVIGFEALIRWHHPVIGSISPSIFIPLLEKDGQMIRLGKWIILTVFRQLREWQKTKPFLQANINISVCQIESQSFADDLMTWINEYQINPATIVFELTETKEWQQLTAASKIIETLYKRGIKFALDDFGTGYSTFEIFRTIKSSEIKIDRMFVEEIVQSDMDQKIVMSLVQLCHSLGKLVCVEGIENQLTKDLICDLGVDLLQGYYFDPPLTSKCFTDKYIENIELCKV